MPLLKRIVVTLAAVAVSKIMLNPASAEVNMPENNPTLFQGSFYNHGHWNSGNTDATSLPHWSGKIEADQIDTKWLPGPIANIGLSYRQYDDGSIAMFISGPGHVAKLRVDGGRFEKVDEFLIPGYESFHTPAYEMREFMAELNKNMLDESKWLPHLERHLDKKKLTAKEFASGIYSCLDENGNYVAVYGTKIYKFGDKTDAGVNSPIEVIAEIDLRDKLPKEQAGNVDRLMGFSANYDGTYAFGMEGLVGVVSHDLSEASYVLVPDEAVDNGIATDNKGGIYIVTSKFMRKIVWDGTKVSSDEKDGAWKEPYEWVYQPEITFSRGSGTTPTLMGFGDDEDKMVIIADAGKPVSVVSFWRDEIPADAKQVPGAASKRTAGKINLEVDIQGTVEWSPHVLGYGVMVFNSTWPEPVTNIARNKVIFANVLAAGTTRQAAVGAEKFNWDSKNNVFTRSWKNETIPLTWSLAPVSSATNTVGLCALENGEYKLYTLDWETGERKAEISFGKSHIYNTVGGLLVPLPDGDYYISGQFGPSRVSLKK